MSGPKISKDRNKSNYPPDPLHEKMDRYYRNGLRALLVTGIFIGTVLAVLIMWVILEANG